MPLRERLAKWLLGDEQPTQRVFGEPIAMVPSQMQWFGAGIGNQPDGSTLLKESSGVADMAQRAIANRIASLQLEVVASQRVADGTVAEEVLDDHPLALLLKRPHPDFSRAQLLRLTSQHITTAGEAYWLKVRTGLGKPQRLVPLYPHLVSPIVEGDLVTAYRVTDANGSVFGLSPEQVIRFRWVDPENLYGAEGYLAPNATATDTLKFAGEHLRQLYGNNAVPPAMVKAEAGAPMPDPATLKRWEREWVAKYHQRNGTQAGLPGWLPPGFDIIFTAMQTGADITPLLDYLDRLQLRNFGVPRSVLGEVVSGDRSSAETNQYVMDLHTVTPITMLIADVLTSQLAPDFDASLSVRFAQFVSSDKTHDLAVMQSELALKVRAINEVRKLRGEDPVPWGDLPIGSFSDVPYTGDEPDYDAPGDIAAYEDVEDEPEEERVRTRAVKPVFSRAQVERTYVPAMRKRLAQSFEEQRKAVLAKLAALPPRSRASLADIFDEETLSKKMRARLLKLDVKLFEESAQLTLTGIGTDKDFIFTTEVMKEIRKHNAEYVTQVNETTKRRLAAALAEGVEEGESTEKIAERLDAVFAERKRNTMTIARTEVGTGAIRASIEAVKQSGSKRRKQWIATSDNLTRDDHADMNGVVVDLDEQFDVGGYKAEGPCDANLPAEQRINCRCDLAYPRAE